MNYKQEYINYKQEYLKLKSNTNTHIHTGGSENIDEHSITILFNNALVCFKPNNKSTNYDVNYINTIKIYQHLKKIANSYNNDKKINLESIEFLMGLQSYSKCVESFVKKLIGNVKNNQLAQPSVQPIQSSTQPSIQKQFELIDMTEFNKIESDLSLNLFI